MDLKEARREFGILIDRCGCSRASLRITGEEAEKAKKEGVELSPTEPSCTPKKCYPKLYSLLYPKGGFHGSSHLLKRNREMTKE